MLSTVYLIENIIEAKSITAIFIFMWTKWHNSSFYEAIQKYVTQLHTHTLTHPRQTHKMMEISGSALGVWKPTISNSIYDSFFFYRASDECFTFSKDPIWYFIGLSIQLYTQQSVISVNPSFWSVHSSTHPTFSIQTIQIKWSKTHTHHFFPILYSHTHTQLQNIIYSSTKTGVISQIYFINTQCFFFFLSNFFLSFCLATKFALCANTIFVDWSQKPIR